MTIEKFPNSQEIAYRRAVAEWRKIMIDAQVPKGSIEAAAEEMARYWLVLDDVPGTYSIGLEVIVNTSKEESELITAQLRQQTKAAVDPYAAALNYAKQVVFELVMQKHGVVLNYEPGFED